MLIRTFFTPTSKLDPQFFTSDTAIEAMVSLLMFQNDPVKTADEFSKEGVKFLVRNYLANEPYDNAEAGVTPPVFDNSYVEIVGISNPHGFYIFAGEDMEGLYNWLENGDPEDETALNPPEQYELVMTEIQRHVAEIHGAFMIEPTIGLIGLSDGTNQEMALAILFPNLAVELRGAAEALEQLDTEADGGDIPTAHNELADEDDEPELNEDVPTVHSELGESCDQRLVTVRHGHPLRPSITLTEESYYEVTNLINNPPPLNDVMQAAIDQAREMSKPQGDSDE